MDNSLTTNVTCHEIREQEEKYLFHDLIWPSIFHRSVYSVVTTHK